jgi:arginine exporter protein ArgO
MLVPLLHGAGLALGLILPLGPQNVFVFSQGAVGPVRELLGKVSALIMWGTALYLARQLWAAA